MDHNRNASVALLMLDIASAKSSLAQLQQTFHAATADHQRTLEELHGLREECDVSPVYADGATAGGKAMSRQLQALHTENLQLKSLLKQEIEARQQLQHQHAALLGVLRTCGMQDILNVPPGATTSAHYASADATTSLKVLGGAGHVPALEQHEALNIQQHRGTGRQAVYTMPVTAHGAGNMHDSSRPESSAADSTGTNAAAAAAVAGSHTSSAYFPTQQQHCRVDGRPPAHQQQIPADCSKAWPVQAQQQPDCQNLYTAVAAMDAQYGQQSKLHDTQQSCDHSQHSSQPSILNTGQQQQQHAAVSLGRASVIHSPEHDQHSDGEGGELSGSESLSSSCTQSAATELLDSDDLEELAGLCDGLISQASHQQLVYAAMQDSAATDTGSPAGLGAWRAERAAGAADTTGGKHNHQAGAYPSWVQNIRPGAQQHHPAQQPPQQQRASKHPLDGHNDFCAARAQHSGGVAVPDIEVLAAELNRLQQQVAAAGIDAGPTAAAVRAALGAASNAATSFRAFNTSAGSGGQASTNISAIGSNSTSSGTAERRQPAAVPASSSGMAGLQQQLAARMAEVKERLSSICNGMLEEALGTGGASARSSSTAEAAATAAGQSVQGYADLHPHSDQAQQDRPAAAAEATRAEPRSWSSSMSSSSGAWAAGALKPQTSALSSQADTTATKVPPSVAFEVHADSAPADAAAGNKPSSGSKRPPNRARVGGPAFWSGSRGAAGTAADGQAQAGLDNSRASNYGPHHIASRRAPAASGSRHSSSTRKDEPLAGSSSESSWATADEDDAEQQEQQHLPPPQQQQDNQQQQGLQEQRRLFASAIVENLHPDAFQTPPKQPQQHLEHQTRQQQYADLENTDRSERPRQQWQQPNMYRTPTKHQLQEPMTGVSGSQQTGRWGHSPAGENPGFDAASNGGRFYTNVPGQWQQRGGVTDGLEGVLFGLKGRVAAEVSQTFSPLKAGTAAGGTYASGSPVTPLKPRNA